MKYVTITLFAFVILVAPLQSMAAIDIRNISMTQADLSIIAHTGQDPVYSAVISKFAFDLVSPKSILDTESINDFITQNIDELLPSIVQGLASGTEFFGLTESIQDTSLFFERGRLLFIEQSIDAHPFKSDHFVAQSIHLVSPTTHSLPAPPTFLLVFTGLISCSRRKS